MLAPCSRKLKQAYGSSSDHDEPVVDVKVNAFGAQKGIGSGVDLCSAARDAY